jgi:hypothetical protein
MWDARLTFKFGHMRPEIWPYSARMAARQVEARHRSLRAQATCPPQHAGAKSETIKAEQIGIDISLVGFAVSLGRISLGRISLGRISLGRISLGAATQSLGEPAFESRTFSQSRTSRNLLPPRSRQVGAASRSKMASGPLLADHFQLPCLK